MKRILFIILILAIFTFTSGCKMNIEPTNDSQPENTTQQSANEFSVFIDDKYITLKDWDKGDYLINILGKPVKESVEVLGKGADTFEGTSIKTLDYEGISIKLWLGQEYYWISGIGISDKGYKTFRGISVGMTLDELSSEYDELTQALDGRTDVYNCGYIVNEGEQFIWFEVDDGVIKEIRYYLELG